MIDRIYIPERVEEISNDVRDGIEEFLSDFNPLELIEENGILSLYYDQKSKANYLMCHLTAEQFVNKADFKAALDNPDDDDEIYKLNRDVMENESAFQIMESDAKEGRSFEDIVVEYDLNYNSETPLKIYGGQHRVRAIQKAVSEKPNVYHGFRIYFGLSRTQKVEIATINNTSIAVSNDLLDRMREQMIGDELRKYFQSLGLLNPGTDFSDKRSPVIPTVRIARTFVVNYFKGINAEVNEFHQPIVCSTGGLDSEYMKIRDSILWTDADFIKAGQMFSKLHQTQREKITNRAKDNYGEFARKVLSLTVVSSWAYAAGLYSKNKEHLNILFSITEDLRPNEDPLNAKALSEARLKGVDPDTYRGLGTRISASELGRMLELWIVLVEKATDKRISSKLANAAIRSYEAKRSQHEANKAFEKI